MPNKKILRAVRDRRYAQMKSARRVYRRYQGRVPELIAKLASPTQQTHDTAFDLLAQMNVVIVPELIAALDDPAFDDLVIDEVVSLLGVAGDQRAILPVWDHFQRMKGDPDRASTAALSLGNLGDGRVLPFLRLELESDFPNRVSNAVVAMITVGELQDVDLLRAVHHRFRDNPEIRAGVANAILAILDETDLRTLERTLEGIRKQFNDRALWEDIWGLLERSFGSQP